MEVGSRSGSSTDLSGWCGAEGEQPFRKQAQSSDSKVEVLPSFLSSVGLLAVLATSGLSADYTGRQRTAARH